jgi:hypothetical protein
MQTFVQWLASKDTLNEADTRYSVEVNFRTKIKEILANYAKISLGYVSAALKAADFHVKQVFDDGVVRILVSSRNWDDGEWVVVVSWNPHHNAYFMTKGFFNKLTKHVSIPKDSPSKKLEADNAAQITAEIKNTMHSLKDRKDRHIEKLKKVPLKRGPKK